MKQKIQLKVNEQTIEFLKCFWALHNVKAEETVYGVFNWFRIDEENNLIEIIDDYEENKLYSSYFKTDTNYIGLLTPDQVIDETKDNT